MSELNPKTVITRGSSHVETKVAGQTMMMDIGQGKYYALEATAQRIWELIEQPRAIGEVVDSLTSEYDVTHETCTAEVLHFAGELMANGLAVEVADAPRR